METETEIWVAIIASSVSLFIGIINIYYNRKISAKQNETALKKTKIELLESRKKTIEKVSSELKQIKLNVKASDLHNIKSSGQIIIDYFNSKADLFLPISSLFPEEISLKIESLQEKINDYTLKVQHDKKIITNKEALAFVEDIRNLDSEIKAAISSKLREIENNIEKLLAKKDAT